MSPPNVGSQRLLDVAGRSEVFDRCLWTPLAAATGARGSSTALVGTAETVAAALVDHVDAGASTLLIRGDEPLADAAEYGRELIPRVRALVAERASTRRVTAASRSLQVAPGGAHTLRPPPSSCRSSRSSAAQLSRSARAPGLDECVDVSNWDSTSTLTVSEPPWSTSVNVCSGSGGTTIEPEPAPIGAFVAAPSSRVGAVARART